LKLAECGMIVGSLSYLVTSPNPGRAYNSLSGVTAIATNDVWAIGFYSNNLYSTQSLTEHWNRSTWSVVPSPNVGAHLTSCN